mmetsp:Transcript_24976/g.70338  ORF Transcript_24976/g.70338 Transcript_24976/m.70338 type:complete len:381 (+) Transcript_24976:73-1215(+)
MSYTEPLCVAYLLCFLAAAVAVHVYCTRTGWMRWDAIRWCHMAEGVHGCGSSGMALYRLGVAFFVVCTLYMELEPQVVIACTFTIWCWTLIGVYFALAGVISALDAMGMKCENEEIQGLCCVAWVLFEGMFCCAVLVWITVWLLLLPVEYASSGTTGKLLTPLELCVHNLNVVFMSIETVVNRLCFVTPHLIFVMYYVTAYVAFSDYWFLYSGVFNYSFIDWRLVTTPVAYTLLLTVLSGCFFIGHALVSCAKDDKNSLLPVEDAAVHELMHEEMFPWSSPRANSARAHPGQPSPPMSPPRLQHALVPGHLSLPQRMAANPPPPLRRTPSFELHSPRTLAMPPPPQMRRSNSFEWPPQHNMGQSPVPVMRANSFKMNRMN